MLVLIDGWAGSGKSVLRGLLDGHPELFVSPVQDSLLGAFARDPENLGWLPCKQILGLRKMLGSVSGYYGYERFAVCGKIQFDSSKRNRTYRKFEFDFWSFDRSWVKKILKQEVWTAEIIAKAIYEEMPRWWTNYNTHNREFKGYVSMEATRPDVNFFVDNFPSGKFIYVLREPEGLIATLVKRLPIKEDYRSQKWEKWTVETVVRRGDVEQILERQEVVYKAAKKYPEKVLVLNTSKIVEDTQQTMKAVSRFLGIPFDEIMTKFTFMGEEIIMENGEKFLGKVNDRPEDLLTRKQLKEIEIAKARFYNKKSSICKQKCFFITLLGGLLRRTGRSLLKLGNKL